MKILLMLFALMLAFIGASHAAEIEAPDLVLHGVPFEVTVKDADPSLSGDVTPVLQVGGKDYPVSLADGGATVLAELAGGLAGTIELLGADGTVLASAEVWAMPGWLSLLPAILAIATALAVRQVIPALFLGLWLGSALANGLFLSSAWSGLLDVVPEHVIGGLEDADHLAVILFTFLIGGMVGIVSRNGGTAGIVDWAVRFADTPRKGQAATGGLGLAVFFDDYANTMIVGTTMRPVTDRLRISREKLAYLVDSTAASVATIALVTTWIGFVVALVSESLAPFEEFEGSAYSVYLNSIPYSFYQILALVFVFIVALSGRDFGPMLAAEKRARTHGLLTREDAHPGETDAEAKDREPKPDKPKRAINAVLPILVLVLGTFAGLYATGETGAGQPLYSVIGSGDPFVAMMWASLIAVLVAGSLSIGQGILTLTETVEAWFAGARTMFLTIIILSLAWALADVNDLLHTGQYLTSMLGERVSPGVIPGVVFILAAATAFATGSSWGAMGIIMPLAVPLMWSVMLANGLGAEQLYLVYATVAAVIGGGVWGDHCSPISDTTILSSLASGCDHIDHVRTQIPYAVLVGICAIASLYAVTGFGLQWWLCFVVSIVALMVWMFAIGKPVGDADIQ